MSKRFQLTPEQLAISEERKAKKQKLQAQPPTPDNSNPSSNPSLILPRPWIELHESPKSKRVRLLSWNLLAQCLVRRELFPTSNCLKGAQRQPMLHAEVLAQDADIMCLQEVDSLDKLLPTLEAANYNHHYVAGPGKKHGCLVGFKKNYEKLEDRAIHYDEQSVRSEGDDTARRGSSFRTRNIGSIVALKDLSNEGEGFVIGTTHLFWHPKSIGILTSGRGARLRLPDQLSLKLRRQAGILIREIAKFRSELHLDHWTCLIAGDFNFSPDDPAYSLLVGGQLNAEHRDRLETSRVVHVSIDPTVPPTTKAAPTEDESGAVDPDKVITNARPAVPADGLLSDSELVALFSHAHTIRSAYDEGLQRHSSTSPGYPTFIKLSLSPTSKGYHEPEYTSYTHYWKVYRPAVVGGLLAPHLVESLVPGLPQKGISGSDHISLCADIILPPLTPAVEETQP
ncbi:Endonuclease/exonuclease/phosphatase [Mycena filopes]|nr:Endonuclease/exonuclease/phosphatase [Mycena filopes]